MTVRLARRIAVAVAVAVPCAGGLAACSGSSSSVVNQKAGSGDVRVANVTITAARGCATDRTSFTAGGITFKIVNRDATAVSEVVLLDGDRIMGEKENIPAGLGGQFAVQVDAGAYTLYCPGAANERSTITVIGKAAKFDDTLAGLLKTATDDYQTYVDQQVADLVQGAERLNSALAGGDLAAAQRAYQLARPFYERIETVAESFVSGAQNLDAEIDARANDVPASKWSGFHRIEKGLFQDRSLTGLARWGDQLVTDVRTLKSKAATLSYRAPELANGAQELLDEVAASKISGEEERYSHIDIQDMANNVQGAAQAFADLQPALAKIDGALAATISKQFAALDDRLNTYRSGSDASGYVRYGALDNADRRALSAAVKAVQEPLSRVAGKVANA